MGKARDRLRNSGRVAGEHSGGDFYEAQARIMGEILNKPADIVRERTERKIYRGWEPIFKRIALFPHVREILDTFRKQGIKMGLLSDFPPETKLENLKLTGYWDAVLCSELTGYLKPDSAPFLELARRMEMLPQNILYVGNSVPYDVDGARQAGMKTALIRTGWKRLFPGICARSSGAADFVFNDYRQLRDYVLS